MLFGTGSFSVMSLFKGYGDNNVDGPNQYGSLRYTGLNKIPTISECFPYWKHVFSNFPVPSSIKDTEPSKLWFKGDEKFLNFVWTFQLFVFLDKGLEEFAMGIVVVLSFGRISLTVTEPIWWQSCQKEAHSAKRMMGLKIHMFLQLEFG